MNEKDRLKVEHLRESIKGYVGPEFAKKATSEDILKMSDLKDERGCIYNSKLRPVFAQIDNLNKKYGIKSKEGLIVK